jgi:hypothetical protein
LSEAREVRPTSDVLSGWPDGASHINHVPALFAPILGRVVPTLTPALVDLLFSDSLGDGDAVGGPFGLSRSRVHDIYTRRPAAVTGRDVAGFDRRRASSRSLASVEDV